MIDVTSRRAGLYAAASLTALVLASAASAQQTSTTQGVIANPPGGAAASPSAETAQQTGDAVATTAEDTGPGWEYYLGRLDAALSGGDPGDVEWSTYEGGSAYYRELFA